MSTERRGAGEVVAGLAGLGALAGVSMWLVAQVRDLPDRADRVGSGSEAAEAVAAENPPGGVPTVPESVSDHTTPPVPAVRCVFEQVIRLDSRQTELAAGFVGRRHDPPAGARASCEGGLSAVGNPTSFEDGPLASHEVCGVLEPVKNAGVEPINPHLDDFVVVCYLDEAA